MILLSLPHESFVITIVVHELILDIYATLFDKMEVIIKSISNLNYEIFSS
jgi:hypothetical protein